MELYSEFIASAISTIAAIRKDKAKSVLYDVESCNPASPKISELCLYLMAYSMYVEESEDLIPYLTQRGIDCCGELCAPDEHVVSSATGLLHSVPGRYTPIINVNDVDNGLSCGCVSPGPIEGETDDEVEIAPQDITFIVGVTAWAIAMGATDGNDTFVNPMSVGWKVRLIRGHVPQAMIDDGSGVYYTKLAADDTLTVHGYDWVQGELVQMQFYKGDDTEGI